MTLPPPSLSHTQIHTQTHARTHSHKHTHASHCLRNSRFCLLTGSLVCWTLHCFLELVFLLACICFRAGSVVCRACYFKSSECERRDKELSGDVCSGRVALTTRRFSFTYLFTLAPPDDVYDTKGVVLHLFLRLSFLSSFLSGTSLRLGRFRFSGSRVRLVVVVN